MSKISKKNAQERASKMLAAAANRRQRKSTNEGEGKDSFVAIPAPHVGKDQNIAFSRKVPVIEVIPSRCKPWAHHNRHETWLTEENCSDLIKSIASDGQQEPALLRELEGDKDYDYEIIYGVRRWFACKHIPNQRLLGQVTEKEDKDCMILMHIENANSKDITEIERAYSFKKHLDSGMFSSQKELGQAMNLDTSVISRYMLAASIFEYEWLRDVLPAMPSISIRKAVELGGLLKDRYSRSTLMSFVEKLPSQGNYKSSQILNKLINSCREEADGISNEIIKNIEGAKGVKCKIDSRGRLVLYISPIVQKSVAEKIKEAIDVFIE